jgi:hypothetical protein
MGVASLPHTHGSRQYRPERSTPNFDMVSLPKQASYLRPLCRPCDRCRLWRSVCPLEWRNSKTERTMWCHQPSIAMMGRQFPPIPPPTSPPAKASDKWYEASTAATGFSSSVTYSPIPASLGKTLIVRLILARRGKGGYLE